MSDLWEEARLRIRAAVVAGVVLGARENPELGKWFRSVPRAELEARWDVRLRKDESVPSVFDERGRVIACVFGNEEGNAIVCLAFPGTADSKNIPDSEIRDHPLGHYPGIVPECSVCGGTGLRGGFNIACPKGCPIP